MDMSPSPSQGLPALPSQVDGWLIEARGGSHSALGLALEAGRKYLLQIANRALDDKLRPKVGASDLVQDTYLEAQRDFGQFRGQTEAEFYGWLQGILANRLSNNARRYVQTQRRAVDREVRLPDAQGAIENVRDSAATPGAAYFAAEERLHVRMALARMDESMRSVLIERTWRGDSFAEIGGAAELFGRSGPQAVEPRGQANAAVADRDQITSSKDVR